VATDSGSVNFELDPEIGLVRVTVRPAYGLESSAVSAIVSALDVFDFAAQATLALNKRQREAMAEMFGATLSSSGPT
jgi:hypothetical protein